MLPTLADLEAFLAEALATAAFPPDDPHGLWRPPLPPAPHHVARLALALEPWPGLPAWVARERPDALWLHRPWRLAELSPPLPDHLGILAHHLAFDERLTTGLNPRLAAALGFTAAPEPFGEKDGRPLGMLGPVAAVPAGADGWETLARRVGETFGGLDDATPPGGNPAAPDDAPLIVAVVGAMNDALIRAAAARGVRAYVTGQWRAPAADAVRETGLGVLAVGHARAERWGLRALAGMLCERWAGLEVRLAPAQTVRPPPPPSPGG